jgi:type II secretory pathway pseudopilin PulG
MVMRGRGAIMTGIRAGHSLPELVVALTFLGASLTAMASTAVLATRWTGHEVARQQALSVAETILDSLALASDPPVVGTADRERWTIGWAVDSVAPALRALRVTVDIPADPMPPVELRGLWLAPLPGPLP